jgi:hypothetical protein
MKPPRPSEKQIHSAVMDHWRAFGLPGTLVATIPLANAFGQPGLTRGLPDLLVIGPQFDKVRFIELKREGGKLRPEQETTIALMRRLGIDVCVATGRDEPIIALESWGVVSRREERAA